MSLDNNQITSWKKAFEQNPKNRFVQNALTENPIRNLYTNRNVSQQNQHIYNHKVEPDIEITDQKSSGRCWIFAALNVIRRHFMKKYKLDNFEFSQSYVFFWDKLERMNYNMECIIDTCGEETSSRVVQHLLSDPTCDGGQWDMLCSVVKKHGLVPKCVFRETHHSSTSSGMNAMLDRLFRECACRIRSASNSSQRQQLKKEFLEKVYSMLCKFLGTPPQTFTWEYEDKDKKFHRISDVSPIEFYQQHVPFDCDDYVCVVNDVRKENPYNKLYTVKYLGNVVDGNRILYLNLEINDLKKIVLQNIKDNNPIWFGCDVGQYLQSKEYSMDLDLVDFKDIFDIDFTMNKEERMNHRDSLMTHAMVISGANTSTGMNCVSNNEKEIIHKWQVENSWSSKGDTKGYYMMTDDWFDEYVYEIAVPRLSLSEEQRKLLESNERKELPPWDPMGSLAY